MAKHALNYRSDDRAEKEKIEAAIEKLRALKDEAAATVVDQLLTDFDEAVDDASTAMSEVQDAEAELTELRDELDSVAIVSETQIDELAKARTDIYSGRIDSGRDRLERVLNDLDGCWRNRA